MVQETDVAAEPSQPVGEGVRRKGTLERKDETSLLLRLSARDVSRTAYNAIREKPISTTTLLG
jgi:hypothetical protein